MGYSNLFSPLLILIVANKQVFQPNIPMTYTSEWLMAKLPVIIDQIRQHEHLYTACIKTENVKPIYLTFDLDCLAQILLSYATENLSQIIHTFCVRGFYIAIRNEYFYYSYGQEHHIFISPGSKQMPS